MTNTYFSQFWRPGSLKTRHQHTSRLLRASFWVAAHLFCVLTQQKRCGDSLSLCVRAQIPLHRALTKSPVPSTFTLGDRISTYEFQGEHKHAVSNWRQRLFPTILPSLIFQGQGHCGFCRSYQHAAKISNTDYLGSQNNDPPKMSTP